MIHTRIRRFNTRDTYPEQTLDNDLCQAVIAGKTIYLRGQCPQDLDTSVSIAVGDPAGQAEQVMKNIDQLLRECGATMEHICKVTVYLTDIRHREFPNHVRRSAMKGVCALFTGLAS